MAAKASPKASPLARSFLFTLSLWHRPHLRFSDFPIDASSRALECKSMPSSNNTAVSRAITFLGIALLVASDAAVLVDSQTKGRFEFIDAHFGLVLIAIAVSVVLSYIGLIGWAKHLRKQGRCMLGATVLFLPVAICLWASLTADTNVHGPIYIFVLPMIPVSILGLILLFVGAVTPRDSF
jgi:hypothetical protein